VEPTPAAPPEAPRSRGWTVRATAGFVVLVAAAIGIFLWIRSIGIGLTAPAPATHQGVLARGSSGSQLHTLQHVLLALAVVIAAARAVGYLFRRLGQPPVIGEVIAGILLGPSLLGHLWPEAAETVLPASIAPSVRVIAQIGIVLYMFLVGLDLNPAHLRRNPTAVILISNASIVLPFVLGAGLSLWLYPRFATSDVPFPVFALFIGVSMSVTAFPVLARILTDRGMHRSRIGTIALTCAAVDDITAWCLLALVISVARAEVGDAVGTLAMSFGFVSLMLVVGRRMAEWVARRDQGEVKNGTMGVVFVALLLSAFATEWIGIHALFGAFLFGAVIPHDSPLAKNLIHRLHDFVVVFFLPAYFALTGMRTEIGLVTGLDQWLMCGVIVLVASFGKFGGAFVAARISGLPRRESAAIGILMNTRGLMELIVLNIGLDLGVISPTLFTMLVLMAIITTIVTTPILDRLNRDRALLAD
jgi:Kef-type K+ transport system membrane component KefB